MEVPRVRRLTPEMRREQTRTYLLEAAAVIFAARGFHEASLDEIAEAAGFTKGAIYSNFGNKEDLFLALVRQRQESMLEEFFAAAGRDHPDATARMRAITEVYGRLTPTADEWALWEEFFLYALRNPEQRAKVDADNQALLAALVAMLEHQARELDVDPHLPAEDLARLYVAIFDGVARQRALNPARVPDDLFARLVTFVGDAVVAMGTKKPRHAQGTSAASDRLDRPQKSGPTE